LKLITIVLTNTQIFLEPGTSNNLSHALIIKSNRSNNRCYFIPFCSMYKKKKNVLANFHGHCL